MINIYATGAFLRFVLGLLVRCLLRKQLYVEKEGRIVSYRVESK